MEPNLLFSELDEGRWEVRKVEVFADGSKSYASAIGSTGLTFLGLEPVPSLSHIAAQAEFEPEEIGKEEFERVWSLAISRT